MKKTVDYKKISKKENDEVFDKLEITLLVSTKNENKLKKLLDDKAFLYSIIKLSGSKTPNRLRIKVVVCDVHSENDVSSSHINDK